MRPVYEIGLMEGAIGIEIIIADEARDFLGLHLKKELSYAEYLEKTFGMNREKMLPFNQSNFGYYGNLKIEANRKILALFEQNEPLIYLAGSLFLLFACLNGLDRGDYKLDTYYIEPLEVRLQLQDKVDGYDLFVNCSADFHCWLSERYGYGTENRLQDVKDTMLDSGRIIRANMSNSWESDINAHMLKNGGFSMKCDRNCCCMGNREFADRTKQFRMSTHNSDNALTLLTFFQDWQGLLASTIKIMVIKSNVFLRDFVPLFL